MQKKNEITVTPAMFQAFDDALTVLREHSKHEGQRGGPNTEAYFGLLAFANAIEEASKHREPVRTLNDEAEAG